MSISYNSLWKLLIDKGIKKSELRDRTGMGTTTLSKLSHNQRVSMEVLEKICQELNCNFCDIVNYVSEVNDEK